MRKRVKQYWPVRLRGIGNFIEAQAKAKQCVNVSSPGSAGFAE
ncbi:hypothetical protein [Mucilaginibacter sp.]